MNCIVASFMDFCEHPMLLNILSCTGLNSVIWSKSHSTKLIIFVCLMIGWGYLPSSLVNWCNVDMYWESQKIIMWYVVISQAALVRKLMLCRYLLTSFGYRSIVACTSTPKHIHRCGKSIRMHVVYTHITSLLKEASLDDNWPNIPRVYLGRIVQGWVCNLSEVQFWTKM